MDIDNFILQAVLIADSIHLLESRRKSHHSHPFGFMFYMVPYSIPLCFQLYEKEEHAGYGNGGYLHYLIVISVISISCVCRRLGNELVCTLYIYPICNFMHRSILLQALCMCTKCIPFASAWCQ